MARKCPFPECDKEIAPELFACAKHWSLMREADRKAVWKIYESWKRGDLSLPDLREKQCEILAHYRGSQSQAEKLALAARAYVKKRRDYTACKEQDVRKKRTLGMELAALEKALMLKADAVMKPAHSQPCLFDPEERTELPD